MKMELKSYPKYMKYIESIEKKTRKFEEKIQKNEERLTELRHTYLTQFAQDQDITDVSKKLAKLEEETNVLKRERDLIVKSDFNPKQLAHEVLEQFEALMKEVEAERSRLYAEADRIKKEARDKVQELNKQRHELATRFNLDIAHNQFRNVVDGLDISDKEKENWYSKFGGMGPISVLSSIPELEI